MRIAFALLALLACATSAAAFPTRQLLIVVPFAPGGSNDIIARVIGERLQNAWGQTVVVENQAGAAGSIGVGRVAKADPDGHTIVVISITFTINAVLQAKQPFDPAESFAPIALLGRSPMVLAVSPKHPIKTPAEFVKLARSSVKPLTYGTAGSGSINHIGAELLRLATDLPLSHVPYRGVPLAVNDMIGGHIDLIVASLPPMLAQIKGGKVVGLAVTSKERALTLPELPTLDQTIAPGYELFQWWGVLAPAGTPVEIVTKLNAGINAALESDDIKRTMAREGADVTPGPPQALASLIRSDIQRWQNLVKAGAIQAVER